MADELPAITKAYDLAREMTQRVRTFPRDLKFVLGDRLLTTTYDILDLLVEAKFSRDKRDLLQRANLHLERLRFHIRLCADEKVISLRQYEFLAAHITELGRMIGGWIRSLK